MDERKKSYRKIGITVVSVALGAGLIAGSGFGQATTGRSLEPSVAAALQQAGLSGIDAKVKGREVYLTGNGKTQAELDQAKAAVESVYGVRWARITGEASSAPTSSAPAPAPTATSEPVPTSAAPTTPSSAPATSTSAPPPTAASPSSPASTAPVHVDPTVNIASGPAGVTLTGSVASKAEADALVAQAGRIFGEPVDNKLTIDPACQGSPWLDSFLSGLGTFPAISGGSLTASAKGLSLSGSVASDADLATLNQALGTVPLTATNTVTVAAPALSQDEIDQINTTVVNFYDGVYTLDAQAQQKLDAIIPLLAKSTNSVTIRGYVSEPHPADLQIADSALRAQAVADYLVANGIDATRLTVTGLGTADPVADNNTVEGRYANQRATLTLEESK